MPRMGIRYGGRWVAMAMVLAVACTDDDSTATPPGDGTTSDATPDTPDPSTTGADGSSSGDSDSTGEPLPPPRPSYYQWEKVEVPGTVCGNGSQYKFFVNYSETSDDVMMIFEPGGGCWDYETCSGQSSLGAANPDGIPDDHLNGFLGVHTPLLNREIPDNPVADWNIVFMPYCTGDVHTGRAVTIYSDPSGAEPDLEYHHNGHDNTVAAIEWLDGQFPSIPRMMVTGCSAGGAGATANYYFIRSGLNIDRSYLLADSGPIFPDTEFSQPLHDMINESWKVDSVLAEQEEFAPLADDFGLMNELLADLFPQDRLGFAFFRRDFNYSRYSYERFYTPMPTKEEIHAMWWDDTQKLMDQFDTRDNLSYYIPYWRAFNDSHCTIIGLSWQGTEIEEDGVDLHDYIEHVLDDEPR